MKVFWSIIALAFLGLGLTYALPSESGNDDTETRDTANDADRASPSPGTTGASSPTGQRQRSTGVDQTEIESDESGSATAVAGQTQADQTQADQAEATRAESDRTGAEVAAAGTSTVPTPAPTTPAETTDTAASIVSVDSIADDKLNESDAAATTERTDLAGEDEVESDVVGLNEFIASLADGGAPVESSSTPADTSTADINESDAEAAPTGAAPTEASTEAAGITTRDLPDGTTLINDRFVLAGSGTKDEPYEITWEYLTSARETYLPRDGKTEIPPHIAMLDGRYVKIGGYLQFPLATPEPTELLVMLNQWDGCCLGIPPTPYDALEVSLATPATRGEKFAVEGTLVGKLKIDPYLVGDWLIGLYLIGDATLDVSGSRSAEEVYGNSPTVGDPNAMPD